MKTVFKNLKVLTVLALVQGCGMSEEEKQDCRQLETCLEVLEANWPQIQEDLSQDWEQVKVDATNVKRKIEHWWNYETEAYEERRRCPRYDCSQASTIRTTRQKQNVSESLLDALAAGFKITIGLTKTEILDTLPEGVELEDYFGPVKPVMWPYESGVCQEAKSCGVFFDEDAQVIGWINISERLLVSSDSNF